MTLSHNPKRLSDEAWWYEEPKGISIIVEHRTPSGEYLHTKEYRIPWSQLRASLERKDSK